MSITYQHGSYREKLFDERWKRKRQEILERDNHKCVLCGSADGLVVIINSIISYLDWGSIEIPGITRINIL